MVSWLYLPFFAVFEHACPCSGDDGARSAAGYACGGVEATVPLGVAEELVISGLLVSKE